jgi:enoyl-CoA hydratase
MSTVLYQKDNKIGKITINRPESLNALNSSVLVALNEVLAEIEKDDDLRVVIITGSGRSFVAGADIKEMEAFNSLEAREYAELGLSTMLRVENLPIPVIASVNGFALGGGCELSLACEIRYASEKAKFGQPEVGLGITPGFGGTQRLSRIVGLANAKELIYTGKVIDANEALRIGLVNKVFTCESLEEETMKLAQAIAKQSTSAVRYAKISINRGFDATLANSFEYEKNLFSLCFSTQDQTEGMQAFVEKRKAKF